MSLIDEGGFWTRYAKNVFGFLMEGVLELPSTFEKPFPGLFWAFIGFPALPGLPGLFWAGKFAYSALGL